ncbi:MAG: IgGFc-binding protein [Polyangiaceae bacterium]
MSNRHSQFGFERFGLKLPLAVGFALLASALLAGACSASGAVGTSNTGGSSGSGGSGGFDIDAGGSGNVCGVCVGTSYTSCASGQPKVEQCPHSCTPGQGCTGCSATGTVCVGNEIHKCSGDGVAGELVKACDASAGEICQNGACKNGCAVAEEESSNIGCEFYAVDLDLSDGVSDPANGPWGIALANPGQAVASVVIEQNDAPVGAPPIPSVVQSVTIQPGALAEVPLPTREVDCAQKPGAWDSPGTCLRSHAYRITSSIPIVVYQFNNLVHGFSTDASLLLPTTSVGTKYRVTGWPVAHSFPSPGAFVQRGYVTVVGTRSNTLVKVKPSWRIKGNESIPATPAGGSIEVNIGPFDVLNLETDDAKLEECLAMQKGPFCADLTGTIVDANQPVVVFSGTEESGVGLPEGAPLPPSWNENSNGCCNQHLEEQLSPVESFGKRFLVTRSPIRSNPEFTNWEEPDILRFVGAAAPAEVTTNLPPPLDKFTLQPGEVKDTWTQKDVVVSASEPIVVAQLLIGEGYVEPQPKGDPSFTIFPAIEQARTEYVFLSISGWKEQWVVVGVEKGTEVILDGASTASCKAYSAGTLDGKDYEARRCKLEAGVHKMTGSAPFQIMAYGYAAADTYSFPGGAGTKKIYVPPVLK